MEVDQNNNLLDLKKAYAEIILNTSKEAAARVMVSERRAARLQYELIVAKQEAIQMMLRFKLFMDSKISEAEMTSRSQQAKIKELEAQLQEAEDIVKDLREELRDMQDKLESTSNNKAQYLDKQVAAAILEEASVESLRDTSRSIYPPLKSQYVSFGASDMKAALNSEQWIEDPKCSNQLIHVRNSYCEKPNLPSIILRSKGELYRNGRTQRIRACERNLFDDDLYLTRQSNDVHHRMKIKSGEEDESIRPASTDEVDTMCSIQKKEAMPEDRNLSNCYQVQLRKKDGTTKSLKTRIPPCKQLSDKDSKIDEAPDTSPKTFKSDQPKNIHTNVDPNLSTDMIDKGQHPKCVETTEGRVKEFDVEVKSTKTLIDIESVGDEGGSKSFICQVSKTNLERVDEPIAFFVSKASNITDEISQPATPNVIKHTFQRKQKTESLSSSDGSISLESRTVKRKREGKQNDPDNYCFV